MIVILLILSINVLALSVTLFALSSLVLRLKVVKRPRPPPLDFPAVDPLTGAEDRWPAK